MKVFEQIKLLSEKGISIKGITKATGCSRNTIRNYLKQIQSGRLNNTESPVNNERHEAFEEQLPYFIRELKRTGVNRQLLWQEYLDKYPGGYSYSQFCYHLQQYQERDNATLRIEQKPGEKLYLDYAGTRPEIVDRETGEIILL